MRWKKHWEVKAILSGNLQEPLKSCKKLERIKRFLQDLVRFCKNNAFSCKILHDILQESCKNFIFSQLGQLSRVFVSQITVTFYRFNMKNSLVLRKINTLERNTPLTGFENSSQRCWILVVDNRGMYRVADDRGLNGEVRNFFCICKKN